MDDSAPLPLDLGDIARAVRELETIAQYAGLKRIDKEVGRPFKFYYQEEDGTVGIIGGTITGYSFEEGHSIELYTSIPTFKSGRDVTLRYSHSSGWKMIAAKKWNETSQKSILSVMAS